MTREEKMTFIERSFSPLDKLLKTKTEGLDELDDAAFDEVFQSYVETSLRCRETLNYLFSEKPHIKMMVDRLSDEKINRLFSSMRVIGRLGRIERMSIVFAVLAVIILIYGLYFNTVPAVFAALGIGFMDILFIRNLKMKIAIVLADHDLVRIFAGDLLEA